MAEKTSRLHLLSYDIANPKRLGRVHRYMRKVGVPIQYSVFVFSANAKGVTSVVKGLKRIINPKEDDIRIYPLPRRLDVAHRGRQVFPPGVRLLMDEVAEGKGIPGLANCDNKE